MKALRSTHSPSLFFLINPSTPLFLHSIFMDETKNRQKKGLMKKTWEQFKSFGHRRILSRTHHSSMKSKSRPGHTASLEGVKKGRVAPEGCFSVYVGHGKQRFVVKTEYANHPLFRALLEEAELEYGYNNGGPLVLPCKVEIFLKVLLEMDSSDEVHQGCSFARSPSSYRLLGPSRMITMNHL